MTAGGSILFDVEQRVHRTADATSTVPVLYRATTIFGAVYTVDPGVASSPFEGACIEPWPISGGAAVLVVGLEHHASTAGPYRALAVALPARRRGFEGTLLRFVVDMRAIEEQALWITALASTSAAARASGRALWGLPHETADVQVTIDRAAEARVPGEIALRCEPPRGPALACPPLCLFGRAAERLCRTIAEVEGRVRVDVGSRAHLHIEGSGPLARAARSLGLDRARPRLSFRADRVRARLPLPSDTGPITPRR